MADSPTERVKLTVSDPSQLGALEKTLSAVPGISVMRTPGRPGRGQLGVVDVLTLIAGSSSLVAAIKVLPEFIRSRRSSVHVTITVRGEPRTLDADNVADVMPIIERLLDER